MLDVIFMLYLLLQLFLIPLTLPLAALWSLFGGDTFLFQSVFEYMCTAMLLFEKEGSTAEWITITVFVLMVIIRFRYKWPKNWIFTLLMFYIAMALVYGLLVVISGPPSEFCL